MHWYTRHRVSRDVDAEFGTRTLIGETLIHDVDDAGARRLLYLDTNYQPGFALLHEDYQQDAVAVGTAMGGRGFFDIRVLSPVDLAVSKLSRWAEVDQEDVAELARHRLFDARDVQHRAQAALRYAIGEPVRLQGNIQAAVDVIARIQQR